MLRVTEVIVCRIDPQALAEPLVRRALPQPLRRCQIDHVRCQPFRRSQHFDSNQRRSKQGRDARSGRTKATSVRSDIHRRQERVRTTTCKASWVGYGGYDRLNPRPAATTDSTTNLRKTAAAAGQSNMFTFGQLNEKRGAGNEAEEEDHSSSGGAVAEQRWGQGKGKGKARDSDDEPDSKGSAGTGYSWGSGGQRLGE